MLINYFFLPVLIKIIVTFYLALVSNLLTFCGCFNYNNLDIMLVVKLYLVSLLSLMKRNTILTEVLIETINYDMKLESSLRKRKIARNTNNNDSILNQYLKN